MSARHLTVIEQDNASGGVSFWQAGDNHSVADGRGVSLADYIHAMYGMIRQAGARRVLLIGCGGGTLATMLHRARVRVTMVDIDAASFEIARTYFHLPAAIECHVGDGAAFLRDTPARYDAIVLDAYSAGTIPAQFRRASFFRLAKSRMRPRGAIFLANLMAADDHDRAPDRIARLMQAAWRDVRLHDADGYVNRNVVAVAGAVRDLKPPRLTMRPQRQARSIARSLAELTFRLPR
ncbi:MAG: fused MFS/spermidine synthase [Rhizomicrobium sp.]